MKLNAFIFKHFSRFQRIPSSLFLTNLVSLDFSYQAIKVIPDDIEKLVNLKSLYLNYCILLENLSAKCGKLDLNKLELTNCWSLKTPPPEVVKRGFFAIMAYLKRLASGSVSYKKTKLMLVTTVSNSIFIYLKFYVNQIRWVLAKLAKHRCSTL